MQLFSNKFRIFFRTCSYDREFRDIAKAMVAEGKELLVMAQSNDTCNRRFEKLGIVTTEDNRR